MHIFGRRGSGRGRQSARSEAAQDSERVFTRLYGPVVYALARKRGFGDEEAADLMREVLTNAARDERLPAADPGNGTVHARLVTATRTAMAAAPGRGPELDTDWEGEFERQLARSAMAVVKREFAVPDWEAFWRTAVDGRSGAAVGRELGMTAGAVHVVKCRVLARLGDEVQRLRLEAESWGGPATPAADQPGGAAVREPGPPRPASYSPAPDAEDVERTSEHTPCCPGRWC